MNETYKTEKEKRNIDNNKKGENKTHHKTIVIKTNIEIKLYHRNTYMGQSMAIITQNEYDEESKE